MEFTDRVWLWGGQTSMSRVQPKSAGIVFLAALLGLLQGGCGREQHMAYRTDRSSLRLTALKDSGGNPWLTLAVLHDPTDTSLCHMRWSPPGNMLAYLDGDMVYTWNPSNSVTLEGGKHWDGPTWSPDGEFIVVSSVEKTLVLDAHSLSIIHQFDGENIVWWTGGQLCYTQRVFAAKRKATDIQKFVIGSSDNSLPAGLTLVAAAPDGNVLLAQTNFADSSAADAKFVLLGVNTKDGNILWVRPAPTLATRNFGSPDVLWNDRLQMAAAMLDAGGGFDWHAYVESGHSSTELKFASSASYSWLSGPLRWIGDELFTPMTLAKVSQESPGQTDVHFWNELALFNGKTGRIRTVSTGLPFEAAAASDLYVALIIRSDDEARVVITPWVKDPNGVIRGITYAGEPPAGTISTSTNMQTVSDKSAAPIEKTESAPTL